MLLALISILSYLITILSSVVLVSMVLTFLMAFNIVSPANQYVQAINHAVNVILEPFLAPIRRIVPTTIGMIDFSPMVLLIALRIILMLLSGLYNDVAMG